MPSPDLVQAWREGTQILSGAVGSHDALTAWWAKVAALDCPPALADVDAALDRCQSIIKSVGRAVEHLALKMAE